VGGLGIINAQAYSVVGVGGCITLLFFMKVQLLQRFPSIAAALYQIRFFINFE
jgi:hypothetical protein